MRVIVRTGVGYLLFAGGLTFLVYGIAQAIQMGNCGSDSYGRSFGPPCPTGFGPMIMLMILGTFVALIGAGIASVGLGVVARLVFAGVIAIVAGVVLGIVDLNDDDSRPGLEIVIAVLAPLAVLSFPGPVAREQRRRRAPAQVMTEPPVSFAGPPPTWAKTSKQSADDIASRLRQLDQLKESGLLDEATYKERRNQILAEL
ncbi:hypothetical protein [Solirubrobacter soli]|uniref:hypothetical protein n=1 Tax=Solirubrobacter soli TaxID=363832 RepID=UPI0004264822|nr:hypothetical protein [Solirubrobacter soli]